MYFDTCPATINNLGRSAGRNHETSRIVTRYCTSARSEPVIRQRPISTGRKFYPVREHTDRRISELLVLHRAPSLTDNRTSEFSYIMLRYRSAFFYKA